MKLIVITPPHSVSDEHSSIHAMLGAGVDYVHVRKPSLSLTALREYLAEFDADVRDRFVLHVPFDSAQGTNIVEQLPSGNDEYCVSSSAPFDKLRVTQKTDENHKNVMLSLSKHVGGFHERDTEFIIETDKRRSRSVHLPFGSALGANSLERLPSGSGKNCSSSAPPFDKLRVTQEIDENEKSVMLSLSKHGQNLDLYNYIFLSPIFPSISKENYGEEPNIEQLKNIVEQIPTDTIALGGIDPSRVAACHELGFAGIACLGHIWNAKTPAERLDRVIEMRELCKTALMC